MLGIDGTDCSHDPIFLPLHLIYFTPTHWESWRIPLFSLVAPFKIAVLKFRELFLVKKLVNEVKGGGGGGGGVAGVDIEGCI